MQLNIKPLSDRVVIEPMPAETTTASGLIIPDTAKEKPQKGIVAAVGNGKKDHTMTVKIGDTVLYGKYSGTELKYEGKDYLIMKEEEIYAILFVLDACHYLLQVWSSTTGNVFLGLVNFLNYDELDLQ